MLFSETTRAIILSGSLVLLTACDRLPMDPTTLEAGTASASIDGQPWSSRKATWVSTGDSLQINTMQAGGWWITLVAQRTEEGVSIREAIEAASGDPDARERIPLLDGDAGGFATLYRTEGSSLTTADGGGTLWITQANDNEIQGCFEFDAIDREGEQVAVRRGGFRSAPL